MHAVSPDSEGQVVLRSLPADKCSSCSTAPSERVQYSRVWRRHGVGGMRVWWTVIARVGGTVRGAYLDATWVVGIYIGGLCVIVEGIFFFLIYTTLF